VLRIAAIADEPLVEVRYLNAAPRNRGTTVARVPIVTGTVEGLTGDLDAIVCCSDLQGIVPGADAASELLGIAVADQLDELAYDREIPPLARTGAVLAGDLYSVPAANKRGGFGEVVEVWRAFADRFAWVAGVAGNHDDISGVDGLADHVHLLDGHRVTVDGLVVGGVGGIIGDKPKPGRRPEKAQLALVDRAIGDHVDLLILHEGPHGDDDQRGNAAIRTTIEAAGVPFVVCGHCHWHEPLALYEFGQVLNVDTRVVVLVRA
jgi:Icc-related predicted phosphoesterase